MMGAGHGWDAPAPGFRLGSLAPGEQDLVAAPAAWRHRMGGSENAVEPRSGQRQARPDQAGTGRLSVRLGGALVRLVARVLGWNGARRQRLPAHLGDHALRDIGIDRATAEDDSTVTFWRLR